MHSLTDLRVPPGAVAVHWFGQSSFAFKNEQGAVIQVDPYFPAERPADRFIHAAPPLDETTLATDAVLLTHDHGDHTCVESLLRLHGAFPQARFYGPSESVARLAQNGIPQGLLHTVQTGDAVPVGTVTAHAVWAKPPTGAPEDGIPAPDVAHLGYVLDFGALRIYISGDPINTFAAHDELLAPIADLKPDIGLLTTHPNEGEFPFFDGSAATAVKLGLKVAVPAHYACFVKRTYDPQAWAAGFPAEGPKPVVIPYNEAVVFAAPL